MRSRHLKILHSRLNKGFTLIEIIIVFAIIAAISAIGIGSFGAYNTAQTLSTSTSDVVSMLNDARSKSISQVKPSNNCDTMVGYQVTINSVNSTYELDSVCLVAGTLSVNSNPATQKTLPSNILFQTIPSTPVLFNVSTGTVSITTPATIIISGYGNNKTINVDKTGNISVH